MTRQTANFPSPRNLQKVDPLQHFIHHHDICFLEAKSLGIIESFHLHYQSPSNSIRVKSYRCQHLALLRLKVPRFSDIRKGLSAVGLGFAVAIASVWVVAIGLRVSQRVHAQKATVNMDGAPSQTTDNAVVKYRVGARR